VPQEERGLVLRTLPASLSAPASRAEREREAQRYWDSLSPAKEAWALRKLGVLKMGHGGSTR
jgi:hypothetical protein